MSVTLLEKAVSICKEVAEQSEYFGMNAYSNEENSDSVIFIYEMLLNQGEAKAMQWLYDNEFLQ